MTSILYLIAISVTLGALGLAAFLWSLKSGQYDDMEGAANRILFDDVPPPEPGPRQGITPPKTGRASLT
jgi:cbb3-type cytochrome oxidase maturation protein